MARIFQAKKNDMEVDNHRIICCTSVNDGPSPYISYLEKEQEINTERDRLESKWDPMAKYHCPRVVLSFKPVCKIND